MRVILSSNPYRDRGLKAAQEAKKILDRENIETVMCLPFTSRKGERVEIPKGVTVSTLEKELPRADLLVCFGGDGTILHAARDATMHNVPILGVNLGSVGFMAELERTELSLLSLLGKGVHRTEERMMLDVRVVRSGKVLHETLALNDAVISNGSMARVAELDVLADDELVTECTGDGVIVATPTGSTAYSMSAGGPIVEPTSACMIVTPVCAHQLSARAMVLGAERKVAVQVPRSTKKHLFLSVDGGKAIRLAGGDRVEIARSARTTTLIRLSERSFYQIMRQKLGGFAP
ncbi:MAG: NAD(+)/NADH kinase [Clostridium sp.]|nr:NAD(+)/NADH kinase [Clostridium sp.]